MNENKDFLKRLDAKDADLIVLGGQVMTTSGLQKADVVCLGGRIVALDASNWSAEETLQAQGLHVLPGVIDSQVHFREPGMLHKEDLEAGTRGAVLGGVTSVFEMPNTQPLTLWADDLQEKIKRAEGRAWCDYAFYIGGSAVNAHKLAELERLPGCAGIKVFMGSSFGDLLADEDAVLENILANGRRRVSIHAEDEQRLIDRKHLVEASQDVCDHPLWRDEQSALLATQRIVSLAAKQRRRLHLLHITTAEEIDFLAQHKASVSVELTPHHLSMAAPECYERLGSLAQMNPPVRNKHHQQALWRGIETGVVDVLGSDHAPHTLEEKARPYPQSPSGMTGVQTLLPMMLHHLSEGRLSLNRLVDLTSAGPARVFGIAGKGRIAVGYDADLSLVDLAARREINNQWIASVSGWTPYDGMSVTGWPIATVVRGHRVMQDDQLMGAARGEPLKFWEGD